MQVQHARSNLLEVELLSRWVTVEGFVGCNQYYQASRNQSAITLQSSPLWLQSVQSRFNQFQLEGHLPHFVAKCRSFVATACFCVASCRNVQPVQPASGLPNQLPKRERYALKATTFAAFASGTSFQ
jgi:hypothetical protein